MNQNSGGLLKLAVVKLVNAAFYISLFLLVASYLTTRSTGAFFLTLKRAMYRAYNALSLDFGLAGNGRDALQFALTGLGPTLKLLLIGMVAALFFGFVKGVIDSDKGKDRSSLIGIGTTILPVSLPEILVVVLLQRLAVLLSNIGIHIPVGGASDSPGAYIIPVIAICVLPACYIARILSSSLDLKYRADYIKTAYGKGLNGVEVLWKHVVPNGLPILLDSLPALSTIFIGNLMVIEYAFSVPGLARGMLYNFGKGDGNLVFASIILLACVWLATYLLLKSIAIVYRRRPA